MDVFRHQEDPRAPTNTVPLLRYQSPAEASLLFDTVEDEATRISELLRTVPSTSNAARTALLAESTYVIACFDSWHLALKATTASQAFMMTPDDALAYDVLEQQFHVAKSKCMSITGSVQGQHIRIGEYTWVAAG